MASRVVQLSARKVTRRLLACPEQTDKPRLVDVVASNPCNFRCHAGTGNVRLRAHYDASIKGLIDTHCQMCRARLPSLNFADFELVKRTAPGMQNAVASGRMPMGSPLSAEDKTTLVNFLTELAAIP
ncbi:MAG: hypothetical protein ACO3A4_08370 [Silvanigrellaceae bacterium]